jgi:hypothetical protein
MRRRTLGGSMIVVVVLLAPAVAHAVAPTITIVVSRNGIPSPLFITALSSACTSPTATSSFAHVKGPATPPEGSGSLEFKLSAKTEQELYVAPTGEGLPDLTQLSLWTYKPAASPVTLTFKLLTVPETTGDHNHYLLTLGLPSTPGQWASTNVVTGQVAWEYIDGGDSDVVGSGVSDYTDFSAAHPTTEIDSLGVFAENCANSAENVNLDDLTIGYGNLATDYDFEAIAASNLHAALSASTVIAGRSVTPSASLDSGGVGLSEEPVTLSKRAAGSSAFTPVGDYITNASGVVKAPKQHPTVTTVYRWTFNGGADFAGAASKPLTARVASKVSLALAKPTVAQGKPIVATGAITPIHPGLTLTLWRGNAKHHTKLARAVERPNGSYSIVKLLRRGHYALFVTTAKDATNTAGKSVSRIVTVA